LENPPQVSQDAIVVARVNRAHGREGGISVELLSDLPGRFDAGRELFVDGTPRTIAASRQTGPNSALLWLEGLTTRRDATPLAGKLLSAHPQGDSALDEGEYYHYQLIGMRVFTDDGEDLGELQEILETGSNDVYIVRGEGTEVLIPAMAQVVLDVDVPNATMRVRLLDGLR
jgi:16S rRNA processing protein RimM